MSQSGSVDKNLKGEMTRFEVGGLCRNHHRRETERSGNHGVRRTMPIKRKPVLEGLGDAHPPYFPTVHEWA